MVAEKENIMLISKNLIPLLLDDKERKIETNGYCYTDTFIYRNLLANAIALSTTQSAEVDDEFADTISSNSKSSIRTYVHVYCGGFCDCGNIISLCYTQQGGSITRVPSSAEVVPRTQVGNDSVIGEYTKINEISLVKISCVRAHCVIGKNVKIVNSVITDHVVIEDNVKIDGCIICNNAKRNIIVIKDFDVTGGYIVKKKSS
ncbi:hypothetical protein BD770DRAFT_447209 [Pilaira anomala]|nr:hypothetical protein BD770DRAFT_447209 [Pilaira anomala]